jgi:hypothetical protein
MKVVIDMCFILLINTLINASFYNCYFVWRSNTFTTLTSKGVYKIIIYNLILQQQGCILNF